MTIAPTVGFILVGFVLPAPPRGPHAVDSFSTQHDTWVAKRRRKRKKKSPPPDPIHVTSNLPKLDLKLKKRKATALLVKGNQEFELELTGPGKLAVIVYQALESGQKKAKTSVIVNTYLDGNVQKGVSFKGKRDKRAKAYGPESPSLSKPKSTTVKIASGSHTVKVRVPPASTAAVVELQYYPKGSKAFAPVDYIAPPPDAPIEPPPDDSIAALEPPVPPPPADTTPEPGPDVPVAPDAPAPPTDEGVETIAAVGVDTASSRWEMIEAQVKAGQIRDGLVGDYVIVTVMEKDIAVPKIYYRVSMDRAYRFIAEGPGTVTVRVHRLAAAGASESVQLTINENDVLLQSVDLNAEISKRHSVPAEPLLQVATPNEYKLKLGPKMSRFEIQPSENATDGVAIRYDFVPEEKSGAMALTLDLGDEFGMAGADLSGGTIITEVAVRERVIQVEKIIRVGGDEFIGLAAGGGVVAPQWRGNVAYAGAIEIRLSLPFADRMFAISVEGGVQKHDINLNVADPTGVGLSVDTSILGVPIMALLVGRFMLGEGFAIYFNLGGGTYFVRGTGTVGDKTTTASAWIPAARVGGGMEVKAGPGWLALDTGFIYAPRTDLNGVIDSYTPGGIPAGLKYRLGF